MRYWHLTYTHADIHIHHMYTCYLKEYSRFRAMNSFLKSKTVYEYAYMHMYVANSKPWKCIIHTACIIQQYAVSVPVAPSFTAVGVKTMVCYVANLALNLWLFCLSALRAGITTITMKSPSFPSYISVPSSMVTTSHIFSLNSITFEKKKSLGQTSILHMLSGHTGGFHIGWSWLRLSIIGHL